MLYTSTLSLHCKENFILLLAYRIAGTELHISVRVSTCIERCRNSLINRSPVCPHAAIEDIAQYIIRRRLHETHQGKFLIILASGIVVLLLRNKFVFVIWKRNHKKS